MGRGEAEKRSWKQFINLRHRIGAFLLCRARTLGGKNEMKHWAFRKGTLLAGWPGSATVGGSHLHLTRLYREAPGSADGLYYGRPDLAVDPSAPRTHILHQNRLLRAGFLALNAQPAGVHARSEGLPWAAAHTRASVARVSTPPHNRKRHARLHRASCNTHTHAPSRYRTEVWPRCALNSSSFSVRARSQSPRPQRACNRK